MLTYGWAYGPGGTQLAGKEWLSAISTGGPADSSTAGGYNTFSMSELLKPLQQTANLIGMKFLPPLVLLCHKRSRTLRKVCVNPPVLC